MDSRNGFIQYIEHAIVTYWDKDALSDYKGITLQYNDVARKIEKLHILFENSGIERGDKIALCGRNSSNWATAFLAAVTYGAVAVPIQHEFSPEQVHHIVNHSDAKLLFVGDVAAKSVDAGQMPALKGVLFIPDFSLLVSRSSQLTYAREHLNKIYGARFPKYFRREHVSYRKDISPEEPAMINYTSGTTGVSKGVMIPHRAIRNNLEHLLDTLGDSVTAGSSIVCTLPAAHTYGLNVELLFGFISGCHLFNLTRLPSPSLIAEAFAAIRPAIVVAVPMVIEKIIVKKVFPEIPTNHLRLLLSVPVINKKVRQKLRQQTLEVFGGRACEVISGGAPLNQSIEAFLHAIDFPLAIAYGTTETAPLITLSRHADYLPNSCGKVVKGMEVKIDSREPERVPGELLAKGTNMMLGYYKNEEATRKAIDKDGWLHTGDLATMAADGHIYIKGRIKNMLLSSNGQNIFPEEIEDKLNSMALVSESLVVQQGKRLIALVCPDMEEAQNMGFNDDDIAGIMEQNRLQLNQMLPTYSQITEVRIHWMEFEKTPKKSIKRYLYQQQQA